MMHAVASYPTSLLPLFTTLVWVVTKGKSSQELFRPHALVVTALLIVLCWLLMIFAVI